MGGGRHSGKWDGLLCETSDIKTNLKSTNNNYAQNRYQCVCMAELTSVPAMVLNSCILKCWYSELELKQHPSFIAAVDHVHQVRSMEERNHLCLVSL